MSLLPIIIWLNIPSSPRESHTVPAACAPQAERGYRLGSVCRGDDWNERKIFLPSQSDGEDSDYPVARSQSPISHRRSSLAIPPGVVARGKLRARTDAEGFAGAGR